MRDSNSPTAHKRDGRHDGFRIIMQISQVSVRGQTVKWFPFFLKAVRLKNQVSAPKLHLGTKLWNNDFIINLY